MSKPVVRLIVISDFVSPPPKHTSTYSHPHLPFPPFLGVPVVFRRPSRATERHRTMLEPPNII